MLAALAAYINVRRKKIIFGFEIMLGHNRTFERLEQFEWEMIPCPSYLPDFAPSEYHLFSILQNHFEGKCIISIDEVRVGTGEEFFITEKRFFYESP